MSERLTPPPDLDQAAMISEEPASLLSDTVPEGFKRTHQQQESQSACTLDQASQAASGDFPSYSL